MALKLGGCGGRSWISFDTNSDSVAEPQHRVAGALVADRGRGLSRSCGRCRRATHRCGRGTPRRRRPARAAGRWRGSSCAAPSRFSTARSGRATSFTNRLSPVRTAHGRLDRGTVDHHDGGVLGTMAGHVQRPQPHLAELDLVAVFERRRAAYPAPASGLTHDRAPVASTRRARPDTWSAWLWVSITCAIAEAVGARQLEVLGDIPLGVDHRAHARRPCPRSRRRRNRGRDAAPVETAPPKPTPPRAGEGRPQGPPGRVAPTYVSWNQGMLNDSISDRGARVRRVQHVAVADVDRRRAPARGRTRGRRS